MKRIEVTISKNGETRVEAFGFENGLCEIATRKLERALGIKQSQTFKPEFFGRLQNENYEEENNDNTF